MGRWGSSHASAAAASRTTTSAAISAFFRHRRGDGGAPFFVFVEREGYDGWRELRLYFDGRTLLRWIEDDGAPHDNDGSSDYADYYYEEGCLAYANATTALSTS